MKRGTTWRALIALAILAILTLVVYALRSRSSTQANGTPSTRLDGGGASAANAADNVIATGGIAGTVRGADGAPVANAIVALKGQRSRRMLASDDSGNFAVEPLPVGSFDVSVGTAAGIAGHVTCDVKPNATTRVEVRLAPIVDPVSLGGHVRDVLGGPVSGAEVWIAGGDSKMLTVAVRAGGEGEFTSRITRGKHELRVRAPGYAEAAEDIEVAGDLLVDVVVHPAASIRGEVVRADGNAVAGARVVAKKSRSDKDVVESQTDEQGRFELRDLPSASFDVEASTAKEVGRRLAVNVVPTMAREIRIELEPAASIAGHVRSVTGAALADAEVRLDTDGETADTTKSGADGTYTFTGVSRGAVVVHACAPAHACAPSAAHVALAGARTEVDVTLPRAGTLRLRVLDKDEKPLRGADGYLADYKGCTTESDGECVIDHVSARKSKLTVTHVFAGYSEEEISLDAGDTLRVVHLALGATVRGTVRWDDGKPAPGVMVSARDVIVRTEPSGHYELRNVRPGYLDVLATTAIELGARGFAQRFEHRMHRDPLVKVQAGETKEGFDLVIARKSKRISGTVVAPDGGPVAYARVGLALEDPDSSWRADHAGSGPLDVEATYSGPDGTFAIDSVAAGKYTLWAASDDYPTGRAKGIAAGSESVTIKLPAAARIDGAVQDERGSPISDFVVYTYRTGRDRPLRVANKEGRFVLGGLAAGHHEIAVETDPVARGAGQGDVLNARLLDLELAVGEQKKITVVMRKSVTVVGRVVAWPSMTPRGGIQLDLHGPGRHTAAATTTDGRFELEGAAAGPIELWTFDAEGKDESWKRSIAEGPSRVDVGDLAFAPGRDYGHSFAYECDGKRALATGHGNPGLAVAEGDEIVSIGGAPVATLSNASLAAVAKSSSPDVPIVLKKKAETTAVTVHQSEPTPRKRK